MLWSLGSQSVGHVLMTEQQQQSYYLLYRSSIQEYVLCPYSDLVKSTCDSVFSVKGILSCGLLAILLIHIMKYPVLQAGHKILSTENLLDPLQLHEPMKF